MGKQGRVFLLLLCLSLLLSACESLPTQGDTQNTETAGISETETAAACTALLSEAFSQRDLEQGYDEEGCISIELEGDSASCASSRVGISQGTVTIAEEGCYRISGTLEDGMLLVDADKEAKIQLVLDGAQIHGEHSAALYIRQCDKVFLTTAEGSVNTLSCGDSFEAVDENNIDAAVFSKEDLTLNGKGTLIVSSPAGHGIVSKDALTVTGGSYEIASASHGLCGKDSLCVADGTLVIRAGKDGLHSENGDDTALGYVYIENGNFSIEAQGDGISAQSLLYITGGDFDLLCGGGYENGTKVTSEQWGSFQGGPDGHGGFGGTPPAMPGTAPDPMAQEESGSSMKGLKSGGELCLSGGSFLVDSADDSIHADGSVEISGGSFTLSSGDDGIHGEESLQVTHGTIRILTCYEGLEALHLYLSGGEIELVASDDGLNAAGGVDGSGYGGRDNGAFGGMGGPGGMGGSSDGSIEISGGSICIQASGDGLDANGSLLISGGYITVCGPTHGDTATLDYDTQARITGGTFIGSGASGMAQTFNDCVQGVIAVQVGNQTAGTTVLLEDLQGNLLLEYAPPLDFSVVILSTESLSPGESYQLTVGSLQGEVQAG